MGVNLCSQRKSEMADSRHKILQMEALMSFVYMGEATFLNAIIKLVRISSG